jgi:hypothetical protein
VFGDVAQTSTVGVNVTVLCHGEAGVSDANCKWRQRQCLAATTCRVHRSLCRSNRVNQDTERVCVTQENHERVTKDYPAR